MSGTAAIPTHEMILFNDEEDDPSFEEIDHFAHERAVSIRSVGRPRVRPRWSDPGVLDRIVDLMIMGHGLMKILRDKRFPSGKEVYREMALNPHGELATRIAQARIVAHAAIMDKCDELASKINENNYNAIKTQIGWYQWHQARLHPLKYGDTKQINVSTETKPPELNRNEFEDIAYRIVDEV